MYYRVIYTDVIILLGENINTIERNDKPYESLVRRMTYKYTEGNIYVCSWDRHQNSRHRSSIWTNFQCII